jgi:hypothetical protein
VQPQLFLHCFKFNPGFAGCQDKGNSKMLQALQRFCRTLKRVALMVKQRAIEVCENEQGKIHGVLPGSARPGLENRRFPVLCINS